MVAIRQNTADVGIAAGRVLRRWYRSKGLTRQVTVARVEQSTGRIRYRRSRKRTRLTVGKKGFIVVNDGPAVTSRLPRYLHATIGDQGRAASWSSVARFRRPTCEQASWSLPHLLLTRYEGKPSRALSGVPVGPGPRRGRVAMVPCGAPKAGLVDQAAVHACQPVCVGFRGAAQGRPCARTRGRRRTSS